MAFTIVGFVGDCVQLAAQSLNAMPENQLTHEERVIVVDPITEGQIIEMVSRHSRDFSTRGNKYN